jgi:hypothetical protein
MTKLRATNVAEARAEVAKIAAQRPGFGIFQIAHDDSCPAIATQCDADCAAPCRPDFYLIEPFADDARNN